MTRPPDFDRVARAYRWCEYLALGPALRHTRNSFLADLSDRRRVLVLGDGDGRFTAELLARHPAIIVTAVDASRAMLTLLERRAAADKDRLTAIQADIRSFTPTAAQGPFDLVVTHFFLDCLTPAELRALPAQLAPALTPDCRWLLSEFHVPDGWLAAPARLYIGALYVAFRLLTGLRAGSLPDYEAVLSTQGWTQQQRRFLLRGLLTAQLWQRG